MYCPHCGNEECSLISETHTSGKDFSFGKGCLGALILGPLGILCGACGSGKTTSTNTYWVCHSCGHKWRVGSTPNASEKQSSPAEVFGALFAWLAIVCVLIILSARFFDAYETHHSHGNSSLAYWLSDLWLRMRLDFDVIGYEIKSAIRGLLL